MISFITKWRQRVTRKHYRNLIGATNKLYSDHHPHEPLRRVNNLQTALPLKPIFLSGLFVPKVLLENVPFRMREILYGQAISSWVQESIITWSNPDYKAKLLFPPKYAKVWGAKLDQIESLRLFLFFVAFRIRAGVKLYRRLVANAFVGPPPPSTPYVIALNTQPSSSHYADQGGILPWLREKAPFSKAVDQLWVCSRFQNEQDYAEHPQWVRIHDLPFPQLKGAVNKLMFCMHGAVLVLAAIVMSTLGFWQLAALLEDLLEVAYARRFLTTVRLVGVASFLGDMANRRLWICQAEQMGAITPLMYYASSYTPFHYGPEHVDKDIKLHGLMANHWTLHWHQTQIAADRFKDHLSDVPNASGIRNHVDVGAFDMIDNGENLSWLPERSVAVFDTEPFRQLARLSRVGVISPGIQASRMITFWENLGELAEELDLVLVHKMKRKPVLKDIMGFNDLFQSLKDKGRYIEISPDVGVSRLMKATNASVALPFTSVCDIALCLEHPSIYADFTGNILNPEDLAMGSPVARSKAELKAWLKKHYA